MIKELKIAMLYPREMNIYGDYGNLEYLTCRAKLRGFSVRQIMYEPGDIFPIDADIILGGGGQDSGQSKINSDLIKIAPNIKKMAQDGVSMLMICGLYQMFGHYFLTNTGKKIPGIGVFDAYTVAGPKRLIGNILTDWNGYKLIGYENHSGLTHLNEGQDAFAKIISGAGNDGESGAEGARTNNVFGSYLHGPILPKNPKFADELLYLAAKRRFGQQEFSSNNQQLLELDAISNQAREIAATRPR